MPSQTDSPNFDSAWVVLSFTGELDMARTPDLDKVVAETLGSDVADAVVDLTEVSFMDSSALRWLLNLQDQLDRASRRLRLAAPPGGSLERLLALSGLADRFAVFPTVAEATKSSDPPFRSLSFMALNPG